MGLYQEILSSFQSSIEDVVPSEDDIRNIVQSEIEEVETADPSSAPAVPANRPEEFSTPASGASSETSMTASTSSDAIGSMDASDSMPAESANNVTATRIQPSIDVPVPSDGMHTIVVANDFHIPFHLVPAVRNWLAFCEHLQPDIIVINGDFLDCFSISDFPKQPHGPLLQQEVDMGREILEDLRSRCPQSDIWYLEGNHEQRIERLFHQKPGLFELDALQLPSLLGFTELNIRHKPYMDVLQVGQDLSIVHGDKARKHSAYSAKGTLLDYLFDNVVIGHTHRAGCYMKDGYIGRNRAMENGGLFDKSQAEFIDGPPNWQNGFGVLYQTPRHLQMNFVEMAEDGSFVWEGELYQQS